jgi:DNA-binding response OmpR family regulator
VPKFRASIHSTVPIILLTADYSAELEAAAHAAGITDYLPKPFPPNVLLDRVAALIR